MRKKFSRKVTIIGVISLTIIVLTFLIVSGSAAQNTVEYVGIQDEILGEPCILLDGEQATFQITDTIKIEGENGTPGTILLQCNHVVEEVGDQGAEKWNSFNTQTGDGFSTPCWVNGPDIDGIITYDWNIIVSNNGNVKLTCHFGDQFAQND